MKSNRSEEKVERVVRQPKPKRARAKKIRPMRFWKPGMSSVRPWKRKAQMPVQGRREKGFSRRGEEGEEERTDRRR